MLYFGHITPFPLRSFWSKQILQLVFSVEFSQTSPNPKESTRFINDPIDCYLFFFQFRTENSASLCDVGIYASDPFRNPYNEKNYSRESFKNMFPEFPSQILLEAPSNIIYKIAVQFINFLQRLL